MAPEIAQIINEQCPKQQNIKEKAIHRRFTCDGCGMAPIVGNRYRCTVKENFDFCQNCEATKEHEYPFICYKNPD